MATEILMPRLGWTMEEGIFGQWLKADGEAVKAGDLLFTVESDKATQEVEGFDNGILRIPPNAPKTGDTVVVGALLGYIVAPGQAVPFETQTAPPTMAVQPPVTAPKRQQPSATPTIQNPKLVAEPSKIANPISPRARRIAHELGVDWSQLTGSGSTGRIVERDIRAAAALRQQQVTAQPASAEETKVRATPIAQRLAQEAGIDLAALAQKKVGEKIERADVEAAIAARATTAPPTAPTAPAKAAPGAGESVPTSRIRRLIAQRMAESLRTTAPVTLTTEADATALVALRQQFKATFSQRGLAVPSYNDLLIKLVAVALQAHPQLNATWNETEIMLHKEVHVGLAVDNAEGLLVPVVRNAHLKSLRQIADDTQALIAKAQANRLTVEELQGGTFTITNLGIYNIDAFTPIINLPQSAILGVGRIVKKPAVVNDQVVPRAMVALSLTFDHRVVDGAPAARFLDTIRESVEEPMIWLVA